MHASLRWGSRARARRCGHELRDDRQTQGARGHAAGLPQHSRHASSLPPRPQLLPPPPQQQMPPLLPPLPQPQRGAVGGGGGGGGGGMRFQGRPGPVAAQLPLSTLTLTSGLEGRAVLQAGPGAPGPRLTSGLPALEALVLALAPGRRRLEGRLVALLGASERCRC